jgi:hypothetical protein
MAVYQISRIQLRRGKEQDSTGLPQLASGELAWAIDTQKLYIGNGSVSEGAPAVGNTQILTATDLVSQGGLVGKLSYVYKTSDPTIQTGLTPTTPTSRTLQDRLDDQISSFNFNVVPLSTTTGLDGDSTITLQRAIDQLFVNTPYANATYPDGSALEDAVIRRVTLNIAPGVYNISSTINIPSYTTIIGAGADKTIFKFNPTDTLSNVRTTNNSPIIVTSEATASMKGATITPDSSYSSYIGSGVGIVNDAIFTGHIVHGSPTVLHVDSIGAGIVLAVGQILLGTNILPNTYLYTQLSPTTWQLKSDSTYTGDVASQQLFATGVITSSAFTGSITGTTLTVTNGLPVAGQLITGQGISANTYIIKSIDPAHWVVSTSQSVTSTLITGTGKVSMSSMALATTPSPIASLKLSLAGSAFRLHDDTANNVSTVFIKGLTIESVSGNNTCLELDSVITSKFEDLTLNGNTSVIPSYPSVFNTLNSGIILKSTNSMYPCQNNNFINIKLNSFTFGIYGPKNIANNYFDNIEINYAYAGIVLGYNFESQYDSTVRVVESNVSANQISNSKFNKVKTQAVLIGGGTGNTLANSSLINVGNGTGNGITLGDHLYPQIYINQVGNSVLNVFSNRTEQLANRVQTIGGLVLTVPYVPEASGKLSYNSFSALSVTNMSYQASPVFAFRLPVSTDIAGAPIGMASYVINYTYISSEYSFVRRGTLTISSSIVNDGSYIANIQTGDEYEFAGPDDSHQLKLEFTARYLNESSNFYTGTGVPSGIIILYSNSLVGDLGTLEYNYTVTFSN